MPGASADSISAPAQRGVEQPRGDLDLGQLGHRLIVGRVPEHCARAAQAARDRRAFVRDARRARPAHAPVRALRREELKLQ